MTQNWTTILIIETRVFVATFLFERERECTCVWERQSVTDREKERQIEREKECVCVWARERERNWESKRETSKKGREMGPEKRQVFLRTIGSQRVLWTSSMKLRLGGKDVFLSILTLRNGNFVLPRFQITLNSNIVQQ